MIEARRAEGRSERFVFAYSDEESLRDFIAQPSIIACGFASRAEAEANIDASPRMAAWKRIQKTFLFSRAEKRMPRSFFAKARFGASWDVAHRVSRGRDFLESAVAAGAFTFYSRNTVSNVLRLLLGISF